MKTAEVDRASYQAARALARVAGLTRKGADRFFWQFGLSQSQFNVLFLLKYRAPGGCSQTEIARGLLVQGANISVILRRLDTNGLISREWDSSDERAYRVRLTTKGRRLITRIEPVYYQMMHGVTNGLSKRDLDQLICLLERCESNIEGMGDLW